MDNDPAETSHVDAGDFTTWLELTRKAATSSVDADVPCGDCVACCTSSYFIHVQPHETAALARIPSELLFDAPGLPDGHRVMGHDENGHCPMFVDGGCSIYEDRPQTCRDYDCRIFAATGIELMENDKALIVAQTHRWKFDTSSELAAAQFDAVQSCASCLREQSHNLPAGSVPRDPTHLAMVALDMHELFLDREPAIDEVADALAALMDRARSGMTGPA